MNQFQKYQNPVEFIKKEFNIYYVDRGSENGILEGTKYAGCSTHARNCLRTLIEMLRPVNILEIGSMHYEASNIMAYTLDSIHGVDNGGIIDTLDIKRGGYTGETQHIPRNKRIRADYWYPHKTTYDEWKFDDLDIIYSEFKNMTVEEIRQKNYNILLEKTKDFITYDLIFIDGDHSYIGIKEDFDIVVKFSNKNTVIVIDNVWDSRLSDVRKFYDNLNTVKWDFEEWNDENMKYNMVMDNAITLIY